ncbi:hypothetical protein KKC13_03705 [bacterium]|nr:hypothetical protein [bacterium]MBU1957265.1 hypothetical protein [bacterium]
MINKVSNFIIKIKEILQLPKVGIKFCNSNYDTVEKYEKTYQYFTQLHRLKLFQNKTVGVALVDLNLYENFDVYYKSINGKNSAAYYSRKAIKREYHFIEIDRNNYVDDIYDINTSTQIRQGQMMTENYLSKINSYKNETNHNSYGVVNKDKKLLAYCNIGFYGEFALVVTLLGHKKYLNDGIMYLMMIEVNKIMFEKYRNRGYSYIMYDTFLGASTGLKKFKEKLGYKPYKVKWLWEN